MTQAELLDIVGPLFTGTDKFVAPLAAAMEIKPSVVRDIRREHAYYPADHEVWATLLARTIQRRRQLQEAEATLAAWCAEGRRRQGERP